MLTGIYGSKQLFQNNIYRAFLIIVGSLFFRQNNLKNLVCFFLLPCNQTLIVKQLRSLLKQSQLF